MTPGRRPEERGNAFIEFAVSFAFLFAVFAGTFQFGYAFYVYNNLQTAIRAGARYASVRTYDSNTATPSEGFLTAVRNMVVYGSPAGGTQPVVRGLTPAHVELEVRREKGVPHEIAVSISGFPIDAIFTTFTLNGKPKVTFPYVGRYAP